MHCSRPADLAWQQQLQRLFRTATVTACSDIAIVPGRNQRPVASPHAAEGPLRRRTAQSAWHRRVAPNRVRVRVRVAGSGPMLGVPV
eukprot:364269-Chlamydomonas_euryale.AAC.2